MKIEYDAVVGAGANEWYGTIIVSNLRYEDGGAVNVSEFLAFNFHSPANVDATAIQPQFVSWVVGDTSVQASQIGDGNFDVTATITFTTPYTMQPADQITIGINGNLVADPDTWLDSFVFAADQEPTIFGTVSAACEAAPDPALASVTPVLTLAQGSMITTLPLSYGASVSASLEQGGYTVSGDSIAAADETVVAPLVIDPTSVEVTAGNTSTIRVTFGPVERYGALDISIGSLTGLSKETLSVTLTDSKTGNTLAAFDATINSVTSLRKLPPSGTARVSIQNVALNDVNYTFKVPDINLTNALQKVTIDDSMIASKPVNTLGYVKVAIKVTAEQALDREIDLRLIASDMNYLQTVAVKSQQTAFSALVGPGHYTVETSDFLSAGVVYAVDTPAQLDVSGDGQVELDVSIGASADLRVRGFPEYLCFGGCARV